MRFQYSPDIFERYLNIIGGVILTQGMKNGPSPEELQQAFQREQQATLQRVADTPLSKLDSLAAWRNAFRGFDVDPTQYRSAAEALLRRLTKKGDIPSINTLVDIGNMVSIRYALPVAVFDTSQLQEPVTVHFANGSERYTILGQSEVDHPEPGEVVFTDSTGLVVARRWCWRQSEQSAAGPETSNAIITVEAHHERGRHDVAAALDDLINLLRQYAGGNYVSGVLDKGNPALSA